MKNALLFLSLASLGLAGGCKWLSYVLFGGMPAQTVEPTFSHLPGKTVAVVVFAGPAMELDYQTVREEVADAIGAQLKRHVEGVSVVDHRQVIGYQDKNLHWDTIPKEKLCDAFDSDYILLVSLAEFSTRERDSVHLARGRITAEASVYQARDPADGGPSKPVWRSETIRIVHPRESPLGVPAENDWTVRVKTEQLFAEALVKNFYKHKVPKE